MRENAPVYWDAAGEVWGIARYEDVLAVSRDPQTWRTSGGIRPDSPAMSYMIDMDDPDHRKRRALVNKGFTPRRVQEREPRIREISIDLLERARARGRFDFVRDVAAWLPLVVIGDMLGVETADHARLLAWSEAMAREVYPRNARRNSLNLTGIRAGSLSGALCPTARTSNPPGAAARTASPQPSCARRA